MILRRFLLFAAFFALLSTSCLAAPSADTDSITKGDDPRLDQKVSYNADGVTVANMLSDISASTGVSMTAGTDKDDWCVQDRKVIVHVTDMKLVDLMQEVSSILRFHWSKGTDNGKATYRLWQDKQERQEEESLRTADEDAQQKRDREKRENALSDIVNLGSLSTNDANNLKATDPWRYVLATEPLGRDVADFLNNFSEARSAFVQGSEVSFPVTALPPQLQNTVQRIAESYDSLTKSIGANEDHSDLLNNFNKLQITINRGGLNRSDLVSKSLLGKITIGTGLETFDIPLFDPSSPMGRALGKAIVNLKGGMSRDDVGKQLQADMNSVVQASSVISSSRDISSDPALRVKLKLFDTTTTTTLPIVLKEMAQKTRLNVISDYFPSAPLAMQGGEKTLGEQLEAVTLVFGSNWTKAGDTLRFSDSEWFKKRIWEVPQVWVQYWLDRGKINNGLLLDDLLQIGNLRDEQIDHTIMTNPNLIGFGAGEAARNRQILRFYAMLKPDQAKMMTGGHLMVSSLSDAQWTALQAALATKGAAYAGVQRGNQFIQLSQSGSDVIDYKFDYYAGEGEPAVEFKLSSGIVYNIADDAKASDKAKK